MSLLEVLVAMGILVAGLSSVAALLPSAGSRFAEANAIDRAAALSANAYADMLNRRIISADLFNGVGAGKAVVFGEGVTGAVHSSLSLANAAALALRIDPTSTNSFFSADDLVYDTGADNLPLNSFDPPNVRSFKSGVCYGAMLAPDPFGQTVGSGSSARLSVALFRKASAASQMLTLTSTSGVYAVSPADEATRKRFAAGCSSLLVLPSNSRPPRWFRIGSSWTITSTSGTSSYVSFDDTTVSAYGSTFNAFGFEGLLRADEQVVTLE